MTNIIFLGAVESPFNYNRTIDYQSEEIKKNIEIGVRTELLGTAGINIVGVRFHLMMKHKEEQIMNYDVTLTFNIEDWKGKIDKWTKEKVLQTEELKEMVGITIGFMRGSLFVQEKSTPLEGMNLPILSIPDLLSNLQLIEVLPKKVEQK
jgi:hypothetical protein